MKELIVIFGMHRSGTSMVGSMLSAVGFSGGAEMLPPKPDNPDGFFENAKVVEFNDRWLYSRGLSWDSLLHPAGVLYATTDGEKREIEEIVQSEFIGAGQFFLKDPRLCHLWPLWRDACEDHFDNVKSIFVVRDLRAVCDSLQVRNAMPFEQASIVWASHVSMAEFHSRGYERIKLNYESFFADQGLQVEALANWLGTDVSSVLNSRVKSEYRHHNNEIDDCVDNVAQSVSEIGRIARDPTATDKEFDEVRERLISDLAYYGSSGVISVYPFARRLALIPVAREVSDDNRNSDAQTEHEPDGANRVESDFDRLLSLESSLVIAISSEAEDRINLLQEEVEESTQRTEQMLVEHNCLMDKYTQLQVKRTQSQDANLKQQELISDLKVQVEKLSQSAEQLERELAILSRSPVLRLQRLFVRPANALGRFILHQPLLGSKQGVILSALLRFRAPLRKLFPEFMTSVFAQQARVLLGFSIPKQLLHDFPESGYVESNFDVSKAVERNDFGSGLEHFLLNGCVEVRNGRRHLSAEMPMYSESDYLRYNLDVRESVEAGAFVSGFAHFVHHGYSEFLRGDRKWWSTSDDTDAPVVTDLVLFDPSTDLVSGYIEPFEHADKPVVSVIVPAYNNANHTIACLKALRESTSDESYEVILIDDCSPDMEARSVGSQVRGIKFIQNEQNLGFIRSCNKAAQQAQGEFLFFLNNDTNVQTGWLQPLLSVFSEDSSAGIVGSKLLYPDGRLQEAGGIIWDDGSGWNYGRLADPELPEFNYQKEVDYVSGCALMIRRSLWSDLGGFDELFVPAYYEDTDLAFRVRKAGFKVIYAPESRVVHFEGVSNGTEVTEGTKRFQEINREKFFDRWRDILAVEHHPNAQNLFVARDRTTSAPRVLYVDHYLPQPDQDAGSLATFKYLSLLKSMGCMVYFIGDNFWHYPDEPYLTNLQRLGIEVLYGERYRIGWKDWLEEHGSALDYAIVSRPHIAPKYIDAVRAHSDCKLIYMAHDLAFLRSRRESEVAERTNQDAQINNELEVAELDIMRAVDHTWLFSEVEVEEINKLDPNISVSSIPIYIFDEPHRTPYEVEKRDSILFVGGFSHAPNVDAILWLVNEVWPLLDETNTPELRIVGSNAPEEVTTLHCPEQGVNVLGFLSEVELAREYDRSLLTLAPLRFGAGVKGKVISSLHMGVPVLTTSVGAEGINVDLSGLIIADLDSRDFSDALRILLRSPDKLCRSSELGKAFIRRYFSNAAARQSIQLDSVR